MIKNKFNKYILILLSVIAACAGIYLYSSKSSGIYTYNQEKDKDFIKKLFKDNWYWLISGTGDYSVDYMLDNRASDRKPSSIGNLNIKVYKADGRDVGFTAYFMKEFYEGYILFLGVDEKARQKGYARKLLKYAINELKKMGATHVRLITRTDNSRARKLYESEGFKNIELIENGKIVRYQLDLK